MHKRIAKKVEEVCVRCGLCEEIVACANPVNCAGCLACVVACPYNARVVEEIEVSAIKVFIEGVEYEVADGVTAKEALRQAGFSISKLPNEGRLYAPCETGGCFSCLIKLNDEVVRACVTQVRDGDRIELLKEDEVVPMRIVTNPQGHFVGGVGTPWWVKSTTRYVEVAIWAAGCNLRCPQCQNYDITYRGNGKPLSPLEAAKMLTAARRKYGVDRMAISGGEPTLNRAWLTQFFKHLKKLNSDERARLHLDTNATILTKEYIDELVQECGVTDVGPDLKGCRVETFMKITGITDRSLAERYLSNSWGAIKYLRDRYNDEMFVGVGVPYNPDFITLEELAEIGDRLASIDSEMQVCVLDYRPVFKRRDIKRPSFDDMVLAKHVLEGRGLKTVIAQTVYGHIGP